MRLGKEIFMVKPAQKIIQQAVIEHIKKTNKVTNQELADSVQVHMSHVQKVSKGDRLLSNEKFDQLCEYWKIDIHDILSQLQLNDTNLLRRKTLVKLLNARKVNVQKLSKETGIPIMLLNQIQRGKKDATDQEIEKIAKVIHIDPRLIHEGRIAIVLDIIAT
jgi:DNA-binding Xre family transcriptional regulator